MPNSARARYQKVNDIIIKDFRGKPWVVVVFECGHVLELYGNVDIRYKMGECFLCPYCAQSKEWCYE
jgi:hypothetical protein